MSLSGSVGSPSSGSVGSASSSLILDSDNISTDHSRMSISSNGLSAEEYFRCEGHAEHSLACMKKYLKAGKLCDVTLISGINNKSVQAHRLVLSAASEYFATMFMGALSNNQESEIVIGEVNGDDLQALVDYCYTGIIEIKEENVETLLSTASLMLLHEVVDACAKFLGQQLHPSNCLGIAVFAEHQSCARLLQRAKAYTRDFFMEVVDNYEFLQLEVEQLGNLLGNEDLNVTDEEYVFQALMKWIKHDPVNRKKFLGELLKFVKLHLIKPHFLLDSISPVCQGDLVCQKLLLEAMMWHVLPERRNTMTCVLRRPRKATMGRLMVFGGMDKSKGSVNIEIYDPRNDTWAIFHHLNGRRLQFGVVLMDDRILLVGGRDGLKTLNTMECLNLESRTWTQLPAMNTHRHGLGVAVLGGTLYAVGGHDGWSYLNTVERWDPITGKWKFVAPMQTQRCTAGVAVLNGYLYAVGGRDGASCLRTVERYDPHTDKWTTVAPISRRSGGAGVAVAGGYLYAIGGQDAPANNPAASRFDCVERYDPNTDTWTSVSSVSTKKDAVSACLFGDKVVIVGGYDGTNYLNTVEQYDPVTNEWTSLAPLIGGRAGACTVAVGHNVLPPTYFHGVWIREYVCNRWKA